ncbi:aminodeoxychorismate synthase component I [Shewanella sp. OMA3-2]|uniref:aminodeoxychorismate synthase component I n=1 Tax=Shewanella sp. OMA3-2 TaxID=2908650 RepID=UPI001F3C7804|nr:aminodeoxychorismate synthase component I [Shewanella sp. OMA3-2]UJF20888.1 aminodeoxychorismate synthase component I [Shewanella sp. OMA3-2]
MKPRGDNALMITPLTWTYSSQYLFELVSHLPWSMFLDSANATHQDARFDIIVFNPIATLISHNNVLCFEPRLADEHQQTLSTQFSDIQQRFLNNPQSPFDSLKYCLTQLYPIKHPCIYPFSGGALGALSYDLGRSVEHITEKATKDIDFSELSIGFYDQCLVYDYVNKNWVHIAYDGAAQSHSIAATIEQLIRLKSLPPASCPSDTFSLTTDWHNQTSKQTYLSHFNRVQEYLLSGDCYQINLTQRFEAQYQGNEWQAYCQLTQANKAPFSAFIRLPKHTILSISPERFIQLHGDNIQTKPIKGTLPRVDDTVLDKQQAAKLQLSEKDRAENVMIVDLLRNDIGKVAAPGSVAVPQLFAIESFPAVHHLVSTVTATLASAYSATDLLKACFPGGSITGAPKIRAMEIIEELEPSRRSMYCGSIGYISQDGTMDTSITIRTLVTENNRIYCWAGGGVVADSNAEAEYQECFDKVSKILPLLKVIR